MTNPNDEQLCLIDPHKCRVFSFDVGTKYTGASCWDRGLLIDVRDLVLEGEEQSRISTSMSDVMLAYMKERNAKKDSILVIEDYAYGSGYFNEKQPEIIGRIKQEVVARRFAGLIFIPTGTMKKFITGDGFATKSKVQKAIKAMGYTAARSSHSADSVALYLTYNAKWKTPSDSMYRRAVLNDR